MEMETRQYPLSCQAKNCGKATCPAECANKPALDEFKQWVEDHKAVKPQPIWEPTFFRATC
ncbi:hypothetical protein [Neptuniibacter sp. QD37_11]|uniref:hypothetical protein n=1 Tax=Neptuniibacter sp. QD37_11 TaxID=3398209 RepID=UPI0039F4E3B1